MFKVFALFRSWPSLSRLFRGGRLNDAGRLPRYVALFGMLACVLWAPVLTYLKVTPPSYTSEVSLILPGSGAQSSVNLADLGQASSSAASAFSSSRVSPTQTYKRLLSANRTLERAASQLGIEQRSLGKPRIKLVDETSLIHFEMMGTSPKDAQLRAASVLQVFLDELDILRRDELAHRDVAAQSAIAEYRLDVERLRAEIEALQTQSGLLSFDHYKEFVAARDELADRLEDARSERASGDARLAALADRLGMDAVTAAINLRLHADPEFQELADLHAEQSGALADRRGRYGPRHPRVTSASLAVAGTELKLLERGRRVAGGARVTLASLDLSPETARAGLLSDLVEQAALCEALASTETSLERQLEEADARLARLAPLASRLDDLSRDYKVAEAVFASALARTDTSKSDVYASYPLVQVLADASLPERATSPKPKIAIAAGAAGTFMLFIGLLLAWIRRPLIDRLLVTGAK